jgi:hypothetical protein
MSLIGQTVISNRESEGNATSNKRELALQRKANCAVLKQKRIEAMSTEKRQAYLERASQRELFKALPIEERQQIIKAKELEYEKKKIAILESKNTRIQVRLSKMTLVKRDILMTKLREQEAIKQLPREEQKQIREQKKAERAVLNVQKQVERKKRQEQWAYLAANWSLEIPKGPATFIVDGNNMRGGGPKRKSRNEIIEKVNETLTSWKPCGESPNVICVFDHEPSECIAPAYINVVFSLGATADDMIVNMVKEHITTTPGPLLGIVGREILVITSDRGLALRVLQNGGKVMRISNFKIMGD